MISQVVSSWMFEVCTMCESKILRVKSFPEAEKGVLISYLHGDWKCSMSKNIFKNIESVNSLCVLCTALSS